MGVGWPADIVGAVCAASICSTALFPPVRGAPGRPSRGAAPSICATRGIKPIHARSMKNVRCLTCQGHSRAYVHHLFRAGEILGPILLTAHNLYYYQELMRGLRKAISEKRLGVLHRRFLRRAGEGRYRGNVMKCFLTIICFLIMTFVLIDPAHAAVNESDTTEDKGSRACRFRVSLRCAATK